LFLSFFWKCNNKPQNKFKKVNSWTEITALWCGNKEMSWWLFDFIESPQKNCIRVFNCHLKVIVKCLKVHVKLAELRRSYKCGISSNYTA
jgi:hypothetical protein